MIESLTYLEFNILYKRFNNIPNWTDLVGHNDGSYEARYTGSNPIDSKMIVHNIKFEDNILTVNKMRLSDIYLRYSGLIESLEIMEELSDNYYKFIFHSMTKNYYLDRYLTKDEQTDYLEFIEYKSHKYSEYSQRELNKLLNKEE